MLDTRRSRWTASRNFLQRRRRTRPRRQRDLLPPMGALNPSDALVRLVTRCD